VAVQESLVTISVRDTRVMKNEVGHVLLGEQRLKSEVLRVQNQVADLQVFEDTSGVKVGDEVELTGEMLSVTLAPGLLGKVYDGLQNPLSLLAEEHGFLLPRGTDVDPIDTERRWDFTPAVAKGQTLKAGQILGTTPEGIFEHKIMVPFDEPAAVEVTWINRGSVAINDPIARVVRPNGEERTLTMAQRWPVRRPLPELMLRRRVAERIYPTEPLTTTQRIIDTMIPVARGGTACIPGPFGSGKTVLQSLIARHSAVDIVIVIACGERAGEVVETITEYPETIDPRTGGSLMDRTIIICNTSSMPVAARESSIYTGITLGEYYRQMGYDVLCIADSTSRWAQAMRETSGRMEEIPGEEAFPAYLDSSIKSLYERAGLIQAPDGQTGSVTLIGTVSPAGGNFEEPVTQATLATVKTFLGLSADRAYKRFYPAIDPLISWSRYLDQMSEWYAKNLSPTWVEDVKAAHELLHRGDEIYQMMQVTGEEGTTLDDFLAWQKSVFLDMVFLQQDAYDKSFELVKEIIEADYAIDDRDEVQDFFTRLISLYKNLNYSPDDSAEHARYLREIRDLVDSKIRLALPDTT
jgi:V/A-type H+-transporting ATPase subunit A